MNTDSTVQEIFLCPGLSNNLILICSHFDIMKLEAASLGGYYQKNYCPVPTSLSHSL